MKTLSLTTLFLGVSLALPMVVEAKQALFLAYPPNNHKTASGSIFFIGSAPLNGQVLVNGKVIDRNKSGHFAPSFPLKVGENQFTLRHLNETIKVKIIRLASEPEIPTGAAFAEDSLTPNQDVARLPGELICFGAIAPQNAKISVEIANQTVSLYPQARVTTLPPNSALLTDTNEPKTLTQSGEYSGCTSILSVGNYGQPIFSINVNGETTTATSPGTIEIISPSKLEVIEVKAKSGVARTGASTDYSRLTPLPQGTRAAVTGKEGKWLRLDYGAWIKAEETTTLPQQIPPKTIIRSIRSRQVDQATEIIFPLEVPVPVSVQQGDSSITLNLYNTVAQTDVIRLDSDPLIKRLDWQQITPTQVQYTFNLKTEQQWGYDLRYEGNSLIFTLQHPPKVQKQVSAPLEGVKILLDPGHGGRESGSVGPTGYPEKDANLVISKLIKTQLEQKGATVFLTRSKDLDLSLDARVKMIEEIQPDLAISIHYNALPDGGNAMKTKGLSVFWYQPQASDLSLFLQDYLVKKLKRSSYGVYWKNLALTRPANTPSILLELGFMINPDEFDWIVNPQAQTRVARAIAEGLTAWFSNVN